jgi:hypothetical protein
LQPVITVRSLKMHRLVLASLVGLAVTGVTVADRSSQADATAAAASAQPLIVGSPVVRFHKLPRDQADGMSNKYTIGAVVRFDRTFPRTYGVVVAPKLRVGQRIGDRVFGGAPAGRVGRAAKHCYNVEMIQPEPTHAPKRHARWVIGVVNERTVRSIKRVTLHKDRPGGNPMPDARKLGCVR